MNINFIPRELWPKKVSRMPYVITAVLYIVAFGLFFVRQPIIAKLTKEMGEQKTNLNATDNKLKEYASAPGKLEKLLDEGMALVKRAENLRQISEFHVHWAGTLHEINRLAPANLWFKKLLFATSSPKISAEGFCSGELAKRDVLEFVSGLQENPRIKEVFNKIRLVSCDPVENKKNLEKFSIEMQATEPG